MTTYQSPRPPNSYPPITTTFHHVKGCFPLYLEIRKILAFVNSFFRRRRPVNETYATFTSSTTPNTRSPSFLRLTQEPFSSQTRTLTFCWTNSRQWLVKSRAKSKAADCGLSGMTFSSKLESCQSALVSKVIWGKRLKIHHLNAHLLFPKWKIVWTKTSMK